MGSARTQLESMPEGALVPPGAARLNSAYEGAGCIGDVYASFYTQWFGTNAHADAVFTYYRTQLATRGWQVDATDTVFRLDESASEEWMRGDLRLQVGIARQDAATLSAYPTL